MQYRSAIGGGLVCSGVLLGVIQGFQYLRFPATSAALLLNTVPFVLVSAAIVYTGATIATDDDYDEYATLISTWAVGSAVGFVAVFVLSAVPSGQAGLTLLFGAVDAGSAGALAGLLIGLYDARSRQTLVTVESFADKLKGLNKYGKALNQSTNLASVSALCIEVIEFVLDGDGAVFVSGDGQQFDIVDTTLPDVDTEEALGRAARDVSQRDVLVTITEGDGFDELRDGHPGSTLAIQIPYGESTAVLFAVYYEIEDADEDNSDLLEILAAHVATALSSVDQGNTAPEEINTI